MNMFALLCKPIDYWSNGDPRYDVACMTTATMAPLYIWGVAMIIIWIAVWFWIFKK